jgi:hypothetical protein
MPINSYQDLQNALNSALQQVSTQTKNKEIDDVNNGSPHGAFWSTMTYDQFTTQPVPNVGVPAVVKGDPDNSNLIQVLKGTSQNFQQMPADGPPYLTNDLINDIAQWIKNGCPK